jgi:hypothetical protein
MVQGQTAGSVLSGLRCGRILTYDDLEHYRKVVTALSEITRLMGEVDAAIPKWPVD